MASLSVTEKKHFLNSQLENYRTQRYRNDVELSIVKNAATAIGEDYKTKKELDEMEKKLSWTNEELDVAIATLEALLKELK